MNLIGKLEVGKIYRTKSGSGLKLIAIIEDKGVDFPLVFIMTNRLPIVILQLYTAEGTYHRQQKDERDLDLSQFEDKPKLDLQKVLKIGGVYSAKNGSSLCLIGIKEATDLPFLFLRAYDDTTRWYAPDGRYKERDEWDLDLTQFKDKK